MRAVPLIGVAILGVVSSAEAATTYYVAPGGDDGGSGAAAAPFATIQHAANIVAAGDLVIVRDGTYTDADGDDNVVLSHRGGTAAAWVVFRAEHRGGAVIDGQDNQTEFCWVFGSGANYVVVEGFEITGCGSGGFWSNSSAHHVTMRSNDIHDIGRRCWESAYGQAGMYQGGTTTNHTYDGNVFHHIGRLHRTDGCSYPPEDTFWYDWNHDHGIYLGNGTETLIINNIFYGHDSGWAIQLTGYDLTQDTVIANNTFADPNPRRNGHIVISGGNVLDSIIENNVFYQPAEAAFSTSCVPGPIVIRDNLTTAGAVFPGGDDTCGYTLTNNRVGIDPMLVDPMNRDYRLQAGSPAIDTALTVGAVTTDFDGTLRPQGAGYDVGAFEYVPPGPDGGLDASPVDAGAAEDAAAAHPDAPPSGSDGALPGDGAAGSDGGAANALDGGCGCASAGGPHAPAVGWGLALLALGAVRRRRRRR